MAVTLKKIAERAGVSVMAVSAVLNNTHSTRVSETTRQKVLAIAAELDYVPNISARALVGKRANLVGCLMRDGLEKSYWDEILSGIDRILSKHNIHLVLAVSYGDTSEEIRIFRFLKSKGIDGCFWVPSVEHDQENNLDKFRAYAKKIPLVALNCLIDDISAVAVDEKSGGEQAADHLYAMGHRKVMAAINTHPIYMRNYYFTQRCRELGMEVINLDFSKDFMHKLHSVPAIFCQSDLMAIQIYRYAAQHGIRIPEDLSVIGYNNMDFTQDLTPSLTTVNQQKMELGNIAAEIMLQQLAGNKTIQHRKLTPQLIVRESVKNLNTK